jgi:hypothetical protein
MRWQWNDGDLEITCCGDVWCHGSIWEPWPATITHANGTTRQTHVLIAYCRWCGDHYAAEPQRPPAWFLPVIMAGLLLWL